MKNKRIRHEEQRLDPIIDIVEKGANKYLVLEACGRIPCYSACCFNPCSTKPKGLQPCVGYMNKYHKNIYYRAINSSKSVADLKIMLARGMDIFENSPI